MKNSERSFARRIDLTSLQLFVAVCELGSIGRAAEREFIAASAVSKRLSDLEATVDTALLYRHSRGVTLTPAGESLLHHARNVLYGLERMQGELSEYADGVRGHVRIHANMSAIVQFLPEDLGVFARKHGQVKIDLQEQLSPAVLAAVQEGTADIGICSMAYMPLGNGQATPVLQHRPDAMCRMIDNGLGVGLIPDRAFELMHGVGHLRALELSDDWARRELSIVARDFDALPVTARLLVEHLSPPASAS